EGTVCPISFVKDTLFPYAIRALPEVLATKWDDESFRPYRGAFPEDVRNSSEALLAHVEDLTRRDVKIAYLKSLQGYLWEDGYRSKAYSTPLFKDVVPQLRKWKDSGLDLVIYSSGSIFAQKLLFEHVRKEADDGGIEDLRGLICAWFDTTNAGPKTDKESYQKIADEQSWQPADVLFLSDNVKEVEAAIAGGMRSLVIDRPGNADLTEEDRAKYDLADNLQDVDIKSAAPQEEDTVEPSANGATVQDPTESNAMPSEVPSKKRKQQAKPAEPVKAVRRSIRLSSASEAQ
ncbi:2,3-diketo-5-methylthio-1-phosphopentane phosphatase, partial [Polychaeton citri CBS 116435]